MNRTLASAHLFGHKEGLRWSVQALGETGEGPTRFGRFGVQGAQGSNPELASAQARRCWAHRRAPGSTGPPPQTRGLSALVETQPPSKRRARRGCSPWPRCPWQSSPKAIACACVGHTILANRLWPLARSKVPKARCMASLGIPRGSGNTSAEIRDKFQESQRAVHRAKGDPTSLF